METQYQPITMDNLINVLEFNGYVSKPLDTGWANYVMLSFNLSFKWDNSSDYIHLGSGGYLKTDLDLLLIALERQGIKLKPLPIESKFDFKQYLLDSGLFYESPQKALYYDSEGQISKRLIISQIQHTKENADKLIEIAKLFKEVR